MNDSGTYPGASVGRTKLWLIGIGLAVLILAMNTPAVSQERFGELNGVTMDPSNAILPGVTVNAINKESGVLYSTHTSGEGTYVIRDLPPGRYSVRFEVTGFATLEYPDLIVVAGRVLRVNGELKVRTAQTAIEVTEEAPLIDTTTTAVGSNVTQEEFFRMPKSRTFQSLAAVAPSVNFGDVIEGGFQVNGASGAENNFTVDGMSTNSLIEGQSRQNAAFEILDEVQVKTGGIEAQYGGALGGVISAITRSGGNAFHGDVHYYFTGNPISAGAPKRMLMDPNNLLTISYIQDYNFDRKGHEAGYSLGGYFIKNRVYFFSAASPQFIEESRKYYSVDWQPVTLTRSTRYWQAYNKVSADITHSLRATAGYLWSPSSGQGTLPATNGYGNQVTSSVSSIQANQIIGYFSPQANYNVNLDWTISPTAFLSIKAARFWDNYKKLGVPDISPIEWGEPSTGIAGLASSLQQPRGFTTIPRTTTTLFDVATRNLMQADFSKALSLAGAHDFKVGIGRTKNVNRVNSGVYGGGGYITLNWGDQLTLPDGRNVSGTYGYYQLDEQGTIGSTGGTIDHMYFQDRWRITRRLSLDIGLRLENEVIPSFRRDIKDYAFQFGWGQKVAPRLGGSFDLLGNGKIKLYGSWGRFYDWVKYELARGTFGGDVWRTYYRPLDSLDSSYILGLGNGNLPGANLWVSPFQDWRIPAFGSDQVDPNIKPMSTWLANAGVEWQLAPKLMVAARYTHNSLRDTIEDIGTLVDGSEVYIYGNPGKGLAKMSAPSSSAVQSFQLPTAKRVYDALELSFTRRFAERWFASGSYVYSRLWGNYSGLQNTDEIRPQSLYVGSLPTQQITTVPYRPGTSASRAYDLDYYSYDAHGHLDVTGPLGSDRPHVLKLFGAYTLPWKGGDTQLGAFFHVNSGAPMSTYVQSTQNIPIFVNGRGDMGRTPIFSNTDLLITHEIKFGETKRLHFEFNAQNLFNQKISQYTYNYLNRYRIRSSGITMNFDFTKGYDYQALLKTVPDASKSTGAIDPRFGHADSFSPGFVGRIGLKFMF